MRADLTRRLEPSADNARVGSTDCSQPPASEPYKTPANIASERDTLKCLWDETSKELFRLRNQHDATLERLSRSERENAMLRETVRALEAELETGGRAQGCGGCQP